MQYYSTSYTIGKHIKTLCIYLPKYILVLNFNIPRFYGKKNYTR